MIGRGYPPSLGQKCSEASGLAELERGTAGRNMFEQLQIGEILPRTSLVAEEQDPFCLSLG